MADQFDPERIRLLASQFRVAIECALSTLSIEFDGFPNGSCGEASMLLRTFLKEQGLGTFQYVSGKREGRTHAWLELNGLIVDITADQFSDCEEPVVVTSLSPFHESFQGTVRHEADYHIWNPEAVFGSAKNYRAVVANLVSTAGTTGV
jgi:hypothetical protein